MRFSNVFNVAVVGIIAVSCMAPIGTAYAGTDANNDESYSAVIFDSNRLAQNLKSLITEANGVVKATDAKSMKDPALLNNLKTSVTRYRPLAKPVEKESVNFFTVGSKTEEAVAYRDRISHAVANVSRHLQSVDADKAAKKLSTAKVALRQERAAAAKAYADSKDKVDSATNRNALDKQLKSIDAALAGRNAATVATLTASLKQSVNAVQADVKSRDTRIAAEKAARQAAEAAAATGAAAATAGTYAGNGSSSGSSRGSSAGGYWTGGSCTRDTSADACQGAVNSGSMVDVSYYGTTHIFSQHNNTGGAWVNGLSQGQVVTINGQQYRVNGYSREGAKYAPASGTYLQTCDGNGNHLVGLDPLG